MRTAGLPIRLAAALASVVAVGACSPTIDAHGHVLRESVVSQLHRGVQSQEDVITLLGSPSSKAAFDENTWYYIGQKSERTAFFAPEITERSILVLHFDETGRLQSKETLSAEDGKQIALVDRETPTAGHELGIVEQLLGNIGRFNSPVAGGFGRGGRGPGGPAGY